MCGSSQGAPGGFGAPPGGPSGQMPLPGSTSPTSINMPPPQSGPTGFGAPSGGPPGLMTPPPQQTQMPTGIMPPPQQQTPSGIMLPPQQSMPSGIMPLPQSPQAAPSGAPAMPPGIMQPPPQGFGGFGQQRPSFGPYGSGISPAFSAGNVTGGLTPPNQNPFAMLWGGY